MLVEGYHPETKKAAEPTSDGVGAGKRKKQTDVAEGGLGLL